MLIGPEPEACCAKQLADNIKIVSKSFTLFIPFATGDGTHASGVLSLDIVEGPPRGVWFGYLHARGVRTDCYRFSHHAFSSASSAFRSGFFSAIACDSFHS